MMEWRGRGMPCWANRRPRLFAGGGSSRQHKHPASVYAIPTVDETADKTADRSGTGVDAYTPRFLQRIVAAFPKTVDANRD
jgi:hypothetical protein